MAWPIQHHLAAAAYLEYRKLRQTLVVDKDQRSLILSLPVSQIQQEALGTFRLGSRGGT